MDCILAILPLRHCHSLQDSLQDSDRIVGGNTGTGQTYPVASSVRETVVFESVLICFLCTPEPFYRGDSAEISAESEAFLVHLQFDIDSEASLQGKLCRIFPRKVSCCEE